MVKLIRAAFFATLSVITACGHAGNKRNSNAPTPPGGDDVLNLAPLDLKVSSQVPETNPNQISVDTAGKTKVHAQFNFVANADYKLRLAAFAHSFVNCNGAEPAPVLGWSEVGTTSATLALTQDSPASASNGKSYVLAVDVDNSSQCESMDLSFAMVGTVVQSGDPANPTPTDPLKDVSYKFETIVREFGTYQGKPDRAVLLVVAPSQGKLEITAVKGPQTSQTVYVGMLEKVNAKIKVFGQSSIPMAEERRQTLLQTYGNATVIYIENYETPVCDGESKEFQAKGTLLGVGVTVDFTVEAVPQSDRDCKLHIVSGLVRN